MHRCRVADGADPFGPNRHGQTPVGLVRLIANYPVARFFADIDELDPGQPYDLSGEPSTLAQHVNDALDTAGSACARLTHG
jgi:hypothetical protein